MKMFTLIVFSMLLVGQVFALSEGSSKVVRFDFDDQFFSSRKVDLDQAIRDRGLCPENYFLDKVVYQGKSQGGTAKVWLEINGRPSAPQVLSGTPEEWHSISDWTFDRVHFQGWKTSTEKADWNLKLSGWSKLRFIVIKLQAR